MASRCEYCSSLIAEDETKCGNCGAPLVRDASAIPDFRSCPYCRRKLLALGSPACNYCGRRLPDEYIKAREADLKRMSDVKAGKETSEVDRKVNELIRQTAIRQHAQSSSALGILDVRSLIDLFR